MPSYDIFLFLGKPALLTILGLILLGLIVFVALGARLDYLDWKRRPRRERH